MDAVLSRFRSEYAMNNREEIDGFLAALICSPDIAKPSEYLPEIYGGKMTHDEAVADREQLLDFWGLLTRHLDGIVSILHEEDVFAPLLLAEKEVSLTPTIGRPGSCVALSCIMKAGRHCSTTKNIVVY
jgi:yecA family protein